MVLFAGAIYYIYNHSPSFEYEGVNFEVVQQGDLMLYKTIVPLYEDGEMVNHYRFFLRNHAEEIEDIPIPEELDLKKFVIFNYSEDILCQGKGNIALANLKQLYEVMGATTRTESLTNKSNITCDEEGDYNYINIKEGNETKIEEIGPACYEMTFKDCEILEVTERYMLKMFVQTQDKEIPVSNVQ